MPRQTPEFVVEELLHLRDWYPRWGASKLLTRLAKIRPELKAVLPSRSVAHEYLKRNGRVKVKKRRRSIAPCHKVVPEPMGPNALWAIDFKGQFKTWDGKYCYPLTITDSYSRYILCCEALPSIKTKYVKPVM